MGLLYFEYSKVQRVLLHGLAQVLSYRTLSTVLFVPHCMHPLKTDLHRDSDHGFMSSTHENSNINVFDYSCSIVTK